MEERAERAAKQRHLEKSLGVVQQSGEGEMRRSIAEEQGRRRHTGLTSSSSLYGFFVRYGRTGFVL